MGTGVQVLVGRGKGWHLHTHGLPLPIPTNDSKYYYWHQKPIFWHYHAIQHLCHIIVCSRQKPNTIALRFWWQALDKTHLRHQFLDVPMVFRYGFVVEQNPSERHSPLVSCPQKSQYRQSAFSPSSTTLPAGHHNLPRHSLEGYGRFGCPLGP